MNVISAGPLYLTLLLWVGGALVLAVGAMYFLRPRTRAHYPGGNGRYLLATTIQVAALLVPLPIVLILLLGSPLAPSLHVIVAVLVGLAVLFGLRFAPLTGPLLSDLHKARVAAMVERLGARK